jgi:hypothetical protein
MVIYIIVVMVIYIILLAVIRIIQPITITIITTITIIIIIIVLVIILILVIVIVILNYRIDNNLEYHHQCMEYLFHLLNLKQIINKIELELIEDIIHHIKHEYIYII